MEFRLKISMSEAQSGIVHECCCMNFQTRVVNLKASTVC